MREHELILHNGSVITLDGASRITEAVAVTAGLVSAAGASPEVLAGRGRTTRVIDLEGRTVCPGFFDSHAHMDREGLKARGGFSLAGRHSVASIVDGVRKGVARTPQGEWAVFMPLGTPKLAYISRPDQLAEGRFPTRHDLDAVSPENPVYIRVPWGWWGHRPFVCVANSAALKLAGIGPETRRRTTSRSSARRTASRPACSSTGRMHRSSSTRCSAACRASPTRTASPAAARRGRICRGGDNEHLRRPRPHPGDPRRVPARVRRRRSAGAGAPAAQRARRPRSTIGVSARSSTSGRRASAAVAAATPCTGSRGSASTSANEKAAAIIGEDYPYEAWAGHFYHSLPHERFVEIGIRAARLGIRLNCLICYDLERVLRAYEAIDRVVPIRDRRWIMIHVIEASADQIRRMKTLGVIATVTPNFMYMASDRFKLHEIGARAMPIRELLDAGVPVALSSDNVPYSMLWTMWEALARWDGDSGRALGESRLSRLEALRLITQTGPMITWEEDRKGTLEPGKFADMVVLDDDPLTCEEGRLKELRVLRTSSAAGKSSDRGWTDIGPVDGIPLD